MTERVQRWLFAPRDAAALVVFRIAFGLLIAVSATRFLAYDWVEPLFVAPRFHFAYWGFEWVPHPGPRGVYALFAALIPLGLLVAAGLFYRVASAALFVAFAWLQLLDVSNWLNHYYLASVLALLLALMPLHRAFSLDAWRNPARRSDTLPGWCTALLRFQVGVVYVFAGLAKLNADWLLHAQPLSLWLGARSDLSFIGPIFELPATAFIMSWAGFLFDTTIVFWLSLRATRKPAYAAVLLFHAATWVLFPIGMFPFIMTAAALVFFEPNWPRSLLRLRDPAPGVVRVPRFATASLAVAAVWALVQVGLPLRANLYGGEVSWHEQGMRFSWRVMTREKNGAVTFHVRNKDLNREWLVAPSRYLTRLQERELSVQPDLILQLAQHLGRDFEARGLGPVEVRAEAWVSWNARPAALLIDPEVDLLTVSDGLAAKSWIRPAPDTVRPLSAQPKLALNTR
jgi:vitamin K-dependent gamma-carboxylase